MKSAGRANRAMARMGNTAEEIALGNGGGAAQAEPVNPRHTSARLAHACRSAAAVLAAFGLSAAGLRAQAAISSIGTAMVTGTATSVTTDSETVTFDNNAEKVVNFTTTTGKTYYTVTSAQTALIQRDPTHDTYAPNEISIWYAYTGSATSPTYEGQYQTDANTALLGNNLLEGSDNLLTNQNGNTQSSGDVERLDFILNSSGESATTDQAFAVFDRGNTTNHDSFKIAVITGVDTNGNPTTYAGNLVTVTPSNYDTSANPVANQNYTVFRYDTGNDLSSSDNSVTGTNILSTDQGTQGVGGVVLSLANLGISAGTRIYGYSIMAADVYSTSTAPVAITTAISTDLVNYMNTTYYPSDTSDNTTTGDGNYGGIDLMGVNGLEFSSNKPAPEPAFYGAVMAAMALAFFIVRRRGLMPQHS